MKSVISTLVIILLAGTLCGCGTMKSQTATAPGAAAAGEQVVEIMPGMLQGYLSKEDQLDSKAFVLPAPAEDSALQAMDTAWADNMQVLRGTSRWDLATSDADLAFPAPAGVFSCALGIPVSEEDTPALYMLLLFSVPPSPRWLAARGRTEEALAVLEREVRADQHARETPAQSTAPHQESLKIRIREHFLGIGHLHLSSSGACSAPPAVPRLRARCPRTGSGRRRTRGSRRSGGRGRRVRSPMHRR